MLHSFNLVKSVNVSVPATVLIPFMADIYQDLIIQAPIDRVYSCLSTPRGLDRWWTKQSSGNARLGEEFTLGFGPGYDWRARVTKCISDRELEFTMITDDPDWTGTQVGFKLVSTPAGVELHFHHTGWPSVNAHFRISTYCWAMYLRILKRYLEKGEEVPYEDRLKV